MFGMASCSATHELTLMVLQAARIDYTAIAERLRLLAAGGEFAGRMDPRSSQYLLDCSARVGSSTIVYTRERGLCRSSRFSDPAHDRGLHLSLSCVERAERDTWVRSFFGEHAPLVWAQWWNTPAGLELRISHWRLFCDDAWTPIAVRNTADVLRAGWRPAANFGLDVHPS